jgi:hypothetical protein
VGSQLGNSNRMSGVSADSVALEKHIRFQYPSESNEDEAKSYSDKVLQILRFNNLGILMIRKVRVHKKQNHQQKEKKKNLKWH